MASLCRALSGQQTWVPGPPQQRATHVLHERRDASTRSGPWKRSARVDPDAIVPVRIGLRQQNLHAAYDLLMEVSHPDSPRYGQHWTAQQVHDMFAPPEEAARDVRDWLTASGVDESHIWEYENKGWLALDIPARQAEALFLAEYHEFEHLEDSEHVRLGCEEYHVPRHLSPHIDYITPGVVLSQTATKSKARRHVQANHRRPVVEAKRQVVEKATRDSSSVSSYDYCWTILTPRCVRALYEIPIPRPEVHANRALLAVYDVYDRYVQSDMDVFYTYHAPNVPNGTSPNFVSINGGDPLNKALPCIGEVEQDLSTTIALTYPQHVTLYTIGDFYEHQESAAYDNGRNQLLDAMDGSYCHKTAYGETGDDPEQDPHYPDPKYPKGYRGRNMCGTMTSKSVISSSFGSAEDDFPVNYRRRQCDEWMKLGLQGVSLIFTSGDFGVEADRGFCLGHKKNIFTINEGCPYLTVVGATRLWDNQAITDRESVLDTTVDLEGGKGTSRWTSGGGFSNIHEAPDYQQSALKGYFAEFDPGYPHYTANSQATNIGENGGLYNRAGRAIPDVSAIGNNMVTVKDGEDLLFAGTSVSAPIFASMIALVNGERAAVGKAPVGFLNPVLYAHPEIFDDIVNGTTTGCGTKGFRAVKGWDPATGLGTVKYPKLLELFMSLP